MPRDNRNWLTFESFVKPPKEILAIEHQLHLSPPPPLVGAPKERKQGQMKIALESSKLNHVVKDVRQKGKGNQKGNGPQKAKVINKVRCYRKDREIKSMLVYEDWMNVPITFTPVAAKDLLEEPLTVEAEIKGYLIRRIHVKPLEKIELDISFESDGLSRRTTMRFIIVQSPSPYNIKLGRSRIKKLRAIPSTIHSMMILPTPRGITTLVTRIYAWKPSNMTGVPKHINDHRLTINVSILPVSQKRRIFSSEKSQVVTKEVVE
ncbi:hypothetical protein Tco_1187030 [Tanacetum coccineum]